MERVTRVTSKMIANMVLEQQDIKMAKLRSMNGNKE
jgi:hypothetical protein